VVTALPDLAYRPEVPARHEELVAAAARRDLINCLIIGEKTRVDEDCPIVCSVRQRVGAFESRSKQQSLLAQRCVTVEVERAPLCNR